jgi:Uma2 family endonuclease
MSSAHPAPRPWTYADLVALPEDQLRHELVDGEHVVTPSPGTVHQSILLNLVRLLLPYLDRVGLGRMLVAPFDVKLSMFTVFVPDLVYFTAERFGRVVNEKHATAAPDLVVEILSPGTRRRDKGRKRAVYDREGVREYWIVDPEACSITALRRPGVDAGLTDVSTLTVAAGDILESPLFPGLQIPMRDVFRGR